MKQLLILVFSFFTVSVFANDSIIVRKDARLDILTAKQIAINKKGTLLSHNNKGQGYRIEVVSTNNRTQAYDLKSKLLKFFPDQKSYAFFQSPNFKVRLGNFTEKAEADRMKKQVEAVLKKSVFVVRDIVEITIEEEDILFR
jgi:hypothetical protein